MTSIGDKTTSQLPKLDIRWANLTSPSEPASATYNGGEQPNTIITSNNENWTRFINTEVAVQLKALGVLEYNTQESYVKGALVATWDANTSEVRLWVTQNAIPVGTPAPVFGTPNNLFAYARLDNLPQRQATQADWDANNNDTWPSPQLIRANQPDIGNVVTNNPNGGEFGPLMTNQFPSEASKLNNAQLSVNAYYSASNEVQLVRILDRVVNLGTRNSIVLPGSDPRWNVVLAAPFNNFKQIQVNFTGKFGTGSASQNIVGSAAHIVIDNNLISSASLDPNIMRSMIAQASDVGTRTAEIVSISFRSFEETDGLIFSARSSDKQIFKFNLHITGYR